MKTLLIVVVLVGTFIRLLGILGAWTFNKKVLEARELVADVADDKSGSALTPFALEEIESLPSPVKKWLQNSGAIGKNKVRLTRLSQTGLMRLKPDQSNWIEGQSEQIINLQHPSFAWNVKMTMSGLPVLGLDQFYLGEGSMLITLFGLIPIAKVNHQEKINQSALQRFLGEIIWTPSAAISPWIKWTPVDERSARATMSIKGVSGEAVFYFSESGDLERFVAMRFKDVTDVKPLEWRADVKETKTFNGVRIPSTVEATWILPDGPFTWFKFTIDEISYE